MRIGGDSVEDSFLGIYFFHHSFGLVGDLTGEGENLAMALLGALAVAAGAGAALAIWTGGRGGLDLGRGNAFSHEHDDVIQIGDEFIVGNDYVLGLTHDFGGNRQNLVHGVERGDAGVAVHFGRHRRIRYTQVIKQH